MQPLFPFLPDWSDSLKVARTFKTDIIVSRSGKEQRRANRNRPRKSFEFKVTEFGGSALLFAQVMRQQIATQVYIADVTRMVALTTAIAANGQVASVDSEPAWLSAGPLVLVNETQMELRATPSSVSGSTLTLSDETTSVWPVGTIVCPAMLGYLTPAIETSRPSDTTLTASIHFDVTPATGEPEINPPAASVTFNSREVFLGSPDWGQSFGWTFGHDFEVIDMGQGSVVYNVPVAYAKLTQKATYLQMSAAAMTDIENVFIRAKGQRGEFYMPTRNNDLPLSAYVASGLSAFTVAGRQVAATFAGDTVFKALCVFYVDGTYQFAQVSSIANVAGASVITLLAPLTAALDPATVSMISWMPACRFASDGMTTEWISNTVAQSQLNVVTVEDLTPEVDSWE